MDFLDLRLVRVMRSVDRGAGASIKVGFGPKITCDGSRNAVRAAQAATLYLAVRMCLVNTIQPFHH